MSVRVKTIVWIFGVLGVVTLCAIGFGLNLVWQRTYGGVLAGSSELEATRAKARKLGIPTEPTDLDRKPPIADKDNAVDEVRKLTLLLWSGRQLSKAQENLFDQIGKISEPPKIVSSAQRLAMLSKFDPVFQLARSAAVKPHCDLHYEWSKGPELKLPEMGPIKVTGRLLVARSIALADSGQYDLAIADLKVASRLADLVSETPSLIPMLVGTAINRNVNVGYERLLTATCDAPISRNKIAKVVNGLTAPNTFREAMKGEVILGITASKVGTTSKSNNEKVGAENPIRLAFEARCLQHWCRVWERTQGITDPVELGKICDQVAAVTTRDARVDQMMNRLVLSDMTNAGRAVVSVDAEQRCLRALCLVLDYRTANGRLPATLEDAGVKEVDPFTGKPLLYLVQGEGCTVYSVGPDGKDNGGLRTAKEGSKERDDVAVFDPRRNRGG